VLVNKVRQVDSTEAVAVVQVLLVGSVPLILRMVEAAVGRAESGLAVTVL
jgi:hypothetical protein